MSLFRSLFIRLVIGITIFCSIGYAYYVAFAVPVQFPVGGDFIVEEDESLRSVSVRLEEGGYISSSLWFRAWVSFIGRDRHIQLGGYIFDKPTTLVGVAQKLVSGSPDVPLVKVTIPEGSTSYEIAVLMKKVLPNFSIDVFGEKVAASDADGRLFPSTYFLLPSTTEERALSMMVKTFEKKYEDSFAMTAIPRELKTRDEVISLAAILEGEAKGPEDMQIVAGILLERMARNMRLQVDVSPVTYTRQGLPSQAINNPGLVALHAALHPLDTDYLYYLTGKDGTMHYAKTFDEHKANIRKYL